MGQRPQHVPTAPKEGQLLLAPNEVAWLLGCSVFEVRRLMDDGSLPWMRRRKTGFRRVLRADVDDYLNRQSKRYRVRRAECCG